MGGPNIKKNTPFKEREHARYERVEKSCSTKSLLIGGGVAVAAVGALAVGYSMHQASVAQQQEQIEALQGALANTNANAGTSNQRPEKPPATIYNPFAGLGSLVGDIGEKMPSLTDILWYGGGLATVNAIILLGEKYTGDARDGTDVHLTTTDKAIYCGLASLPILLAVSYTSPWLMLLSAVPLFFAFHDLPDFTGNMGRDDCDSRPGRDHHGRAGYREDKSRKRPCPEWLNKLFGAPAQVTYRVSDAAHSVSKKAGKVADKLKFAKERAKRTGNNAGCCGGIGTVFWWIWQIISWTWWFFWTVVLMPFKILMCGRNAYEKTNAFSGALRAY